MSIFAKKKYFVKWQKVNGIMILAWKKQGNINQEVNFMKNACLRMMLQENMDG